MSFGLPGTSGAAGHGEAEGQRKRRSARASRAGEGADTARPWKPSLASRTRLHEELQVTACSILTLD